MKRYIIAVALIALVGISSVSFAESNKGYAGIQYGIGYYEDDMDLNIKPGILVGKAGFNFNKYFAVEGRLGKGVRKDSDELFNVDVQLEVDSLYGAYGVATLPVNDVVNFYGLVGYTEVNFTARVNSLNISESGDDDGLSYGAGGNINLTHNVALNVEYVRYLNKSDYDFDVLSAGLVLSF